MSEPIDELKNEPSACKELEKQPLEAHICTDGMSFDDLRSTFASLGDRVLVHVLVRLGSGDAAVARITRVVIRDGESLLSVARCAAKSARKCYESQGHIVASTSITSKEAYDKYTSRFVAAMRIAEKLERELTLQAEM